EGHRERSETPPNEEPCPRAAKCLVLPLRSRALLQILDRPIDDVPIDAALLFRVPEQKAVITHRIDEPRNAARVGRDAIHGRVVEQAQVSRPRNTQPSADIDTRLLQS